MQIEIDHQTFLDSFGRLGSQQRRRTQEFIERLERDPTTVGLHVEPILDDTYPNMPAQMCSGRVTQGYRAILWREGERYRLLYVGKHDEAYRWAERKGYKRHPTTGGLQLVTSPMGYELPADEAATPDATPILAAHTGETLLALGVPPDWVGPLRRVTDEIELLELLTGDILPRDVQERVYRLWRGEQVSPAPVITPDAPPESHPDAPRFLLIGDGAGGDAEVARLFTEPRPVWVNFLHPAQRELVEARFRGPAKVSGAAGTGKTVVAMHRARHVARQGKRVLMTTYVTTLCDDIAESLSLLCTAAERARIDVRTVHSAAGRVLSQAQEDWAALTDKKWLSRVAQAVRESGCDLSHLNPRPVSVPAFVAAEMDAVIDAQNLTSWEGYMKAPRRGRGTPLTVVDRKRVWDAVALLRSRSAARRETTYSGLCVRATELLRSGRARSPYDAVIVDEVQDLGPQELRFLAALAGTGDDALMVVGDVGQRIFRRPVSLRACGIETRGRSHVLRVNYRTTHQIRGFADAMLGDVPDEDDELAANRRARSVVRGPEPVWRGFATEDEQDAAVVDAIRALAVPGEDADAMPYGEIAVFAPTNTRVDRVYQRLVAAGIPARRLHETDRKDGTPRVSVGTMHRAKGLEYRAVFAVDVTEGVVNQPPPETENPDPRDRADAERRQRHLLYVSLTRARNELHVYWVGEPCVYLLDAMTVPTAA